MSRSAEDTRYVSFLKIHVKWASSFASVKNLSNSRFLRSTNHMELAKPVFPLPENDEVQVILKGSYLT